MPDCDYCDAEFTGEDAYLDHLAADHQGELSSIDQRRVADRTRDDPLLSRGAIAVTIISVTILAAFGAIFAFGDVGPVTPGSAGLDRLPDSGDSDLLSNAETVPNEGNQHVGQDTDPEYDTMPPASGPHYSSPAEAGFYDAESAPALGHVVHSLEHGAVVVYYDPAGISDDAKDDLRSLASEFTDPWGSVVAVPTPVEDPESTYVVTAWDNRLRMDEYDGDTVEAFLAEYLGRGPENEVR